MEDKLVRMRAQKMADEEPNSPLITRMAKDLEREGTIGDRLYKAAVDRISIGGLRPYAHP